MNRGYASPRNPGIQSKKDDGLWHFLLCILGGVLVITTPISWLIIKDSQEDGRKTDHCHSLGGFVEYRGGYTYCVRANHDIIAEWSQL